MLRSSVPRAGLVAGGAFLLLLAACEPDRVGGVDVEDELLVPATLSLSVGTTRELDARVVRRGRDTLAANEMIWRTADTAIARIVGARILVARRVGRTSVIGSWRGRTATMALTVSAPVAALSLAPAELTLRELDSVTVTATPRDADGAPILGRPISWMSTDSNVARVAAGVVTGKVQGTTTVIATVEGISATQTVHVLPAAVASVAVRLNSPSIAAGQLVQAFADPRDRNGRGLVNRVVAWRSSNAAVATVDGNGLVRGVAPGTAEITATIEGQSASAPLTVVPAVVASVELTPASANLGLNQSLRFVATARDDDGREIPGRTIVWSSSAPGVASVATDGTVTGRALGGASITATIDGRTATGPVNVVPAGEAVPVVTPSTLALVVGQASTLVAQMRDQAGNAIPASFTWSSANSGIASVAVDGRVTGIAAGTTTISASADGKTAAATVTVSPVPVASVTVAPTALSLVVAQTATVAATCRDAQGNALAGRTVQWGSNGTGIATVDALGVVRAIAAGSTSIVASCEGQTAVVPVTVSAAPVASVQIAPDGATLEVNGQTQFVAIARDAAGNILNGRPVDWRSTVPSVAAVSAGRVTALAQGTTLVVATVEGRADSATVVVNAPPPPPPPADLGCAAPQAGWIWCDDFEQDRSARYFEVNTAGGSFGRVAGVGVGGTSGMRARWNTGQQEAGNLKVAFGRTPSTYLRPVDAGTANHREIYWRVFLRRQAGWTGGGGDKLSRAHVIATGSWAQAAVGHVWSGSAPNENYLVVDPVSGTDEAGTLRATTYNDAIRWLGSARGNTPVFGSGYANQWVCVESRMRLNDAGQSNGVLETWVDGTLEAQRTGLNFLGSYAAYGINAVFLENYWNTGSPVAQERYMDDFVVSTQRIGCTPLASSGGSQQVSSVTVTGVPSQLEVGRTAQAQAQARDAAGALVSGRAVQWQSTNVAVATVSSTGLVTVQGAGTTEIVATIDGVPGRVTLAGTVPPPAGAIPAPGPNSRIFMDLRQSLQQVTTLEQAWALFPGNDHSGARTTRNTSTGWSFTTSFDGQGTRALRADWRANPAGDERIVIISKLPTPKPRELCVQYKTYTGRHPADPDGNGEVGIYPVYPNGMSAKRLLFLRDVGDGGGLNRIDYTWTRAEPSTARVQMNDLNWAVGASTARWTVAGSLNKTYTQTVCLRAASANGVNDGIYRMWVDGTLIIDLVNAPLQSYGVDRWQFPDTQHNNPIPASEYFWDVLVWTP